MTGSDPWFTNVRPVTADVQSDVLREHFALETAHPRAGRPVVAIECDPSEQAAEDAWLARSARIVAARRARKGRGDA